MGIEGHKILIAKKYLNKIDIASCRQTKKFDYIYKIPILTVAILVM